MSKKLRNGVVFYALKRDAQKFAEELIDVASALNEIAEISYGRYDKIIGHLSEDEAEANGDNEIADNYKYLHTELSRAVTGILEILDGIDGL